MTLIGMVTCGEDRLTLKIKILDDYIDGKEIDIEVPVKIIDEERMPGLKRTCGELCPLEKAGCCVDGKDDMDICGTVITDTIGTADWYFEVSAEDAKALYSTVLAALGRKRSGLVKKRIFKRG